MENRAENEEDWEIGSDEDAKELLNYQPKTPYDGIKKLWSAVLFQAAEYATGNVTNDHDCGGKEEIRQQIRKNSIRFLMGNGNLKFACEAAGVPMETVRNMGKKYEYLLREQHV